MAAHTHTTPPGVNDTLLPRAGIVGVPCPTPPLTAETVAMLDAIGPEVLPEPSLEADVPRRGARRICATVGQTSVAVARHDAAPIPSLPAAFSRRRAIFGPVEAEAIAPAEGDAASRRSVHIDTPAGQLADASRGDIPTTEPSRHDIMSVEPDLAAARALHARRQLEAALDHGTAMLAALGLPPLRSMTRAMALLDAIDAPSEDREDGADDEPDSDGEDDDTAEPWLGAPEKDPACGYGLGISRDGRPYQSQAHWADGSRLDADREVEDEHGGDALDAGEETLGWAANVSQLGLGQNTADGDITAPERHGRGFVRCGADDIEDDEREGPDDNGIADIDGQAEQRQFRRKLRRNYRLGAGRWPSSVIAMPWSTGGYVA